MLKKILKILGLLFILLVFVIFTCNIIISNTADGKTFTDISSTPKNRVGLVLGTSNKLTNGSPNPYYTYRINATKALYNAGKIEFILVSGDNGSIYYNEPDTFKKDLIKAGIPERAIFLDYAGFRTLDSMFRAKFIFGLNNVTVISQKFHNERAIYIAKQKGLNAIGFNAQDVSTSQGIKVQLREYLARVKVFIDMLLNTQPKFYGTTIEIK
ncbi:MULTISPECIES: SanA/YdcF family protein [Maribacter]|uniref:SanA/YdcF family protein n=1 Tax=Maribacter TaxID=252356 RepID=UPI0007198F0F|nr:MULTISPECIES: ElyC/SanA/YdcF family protein [Maribacter]APA64857.1 protein SanA [Maribacter sp. 1_2014MBL_MicDiv]KSA15023.1 putative transport-related membrane protein [Maribacter dokdonensis DSW-8]CAG2534872.1 SanA protein [Maribacter dokdonensis]|tara:strand:- start:33302 stop:33937 length:636 start_codon:yes stop_codon:yes gene_type:complete